MKIGILTLTSCWGCSFEFLNLKGYLLKLFKEVKIVKFNLIKESEDYSEIDVLFVEGAVSTKKEKELLIEARKKAKFLIALGSCAVNGNIIYLRNFIDERELNEIYKQKIKIDESLAPIDKIVKVDYFLPGCPFLKKELVEVLREIKKGELPREKDYPVCIECKRRGRNCFLMKGVLCLGPLIKGGCNAICVSNNFPCWGCRGFHKDANIKAFIKSVSKRVGISEKEIEEKLKLYCLR